MLEKNIINPTSSPWATPINLVKKKNSMTQSLNCKKLKSESEKNFSKYGKRKNFF